MIRARSPNKAGFAATGGQRKPRLTAILPRTYAAGAGTRGGLAVGPSRGFAHRAAPNRGAPVVKEQFDESQRYEES